MDKKIINDILTAEPFKELSTEELTEELDKEMKKDEPDYDLIDELTAAILEAKNMSVSMENEDLKEQAAIIKKKADKKKSHFRIPKWAVAACAALITVTIANTVSVAALGMNIFSVAIEYTKSGFSVDFDEQEHIDLPKSEDDPYGFIAKLAEFDIEFETPHYIPEGFVFTDVTTNVNEGYATDVVFFFEKEKQNFSFGYTKYHDKVGKSLIPSDHFNLSETKVNGSTAIVSKEDNQYVITYQKEKTVFLMFAVDVPYDECEKIVESIK